MKKGGLILARKSKRAERLDVTSWIDAALSMLADHGMDAVRIEPLATRLSVTKGSFYWHFKNRRALIDALLIEWRNGRIKAIAAQTRAGADPQHTLRGLAEVYTRQANIRGLAIELAIRSFARRDARALAAVAAVDRERFERVQALFRALGYPSAAAQAQGILFYSFLFGRSLIDTRRMTQAITESAIARLVAKP